MRVTRSAFGRGRSNRMIAALTCESSPYVFAIAASGASCCSSRSTAKSRTRVFDQKTFTNVSKDSMSNIRFGGELSTALIHRSTMASRSFREPAPQSVEPSLLNTAGSITVQVVVFKEIYTKILDK